MREDVKKALEEAILEINKEYVPAFDVTVNYMDYTGLKPLRSKKLRHIKKYNKKATRRSVTYRECRVTGVKKV